MGKPKYIEGLCVGFALRFCHFLAKSKGDFTSNDKNSDMILKEKLAPEGKNRIWMYREGLFWKLYNESAYFFLKLVKSYQVKVKYVKEVKATVASIGFPDTVLEHNLKCLGIHTSGVNRSENIIEIELIEPVSGFSEWFNNMVIQANVGDEERMRVRKPEIPVQAIQAEAKYEDDVRRILKDLRDFPLIQKTPLEVQMFMMELQVRANKVGTVDEY